MASKLTRHQFHKELMKNDKKNQNFIITNQETKKKMIQTIEVVDPTVQ